MCLWDDKGPTKVYQALQDDILNFISNAQTVSISVLFVCLILYVPSTIFQLCRDGSSWVEPVLS